MIRFTDYEVDISSSFIVLLFNILMEEQTREMAWKIVQPYYNRKFIELIIIQSSFNHHHFSLFYYSFIANITYRNHFFIIIIHCIIQEMHGFPIILQSPSSSHSLPPSSPHHHRYRYSLHERSCNCISPIHILPYSQMPIYCEWTNSNYFYSSHFHSESKSLSSDYEVDVFPV